MGITNFDKIAAETGFYLGPSGSEKALTGLFEPGNQFFVDSDTGADGNTGLSWGSALATVDAAIGKCTANNGDIIWIAPGHTETWTTTGAKLVADIAGVRIIGLGQGANRPTFSFGHTGTTWTISAASVTLCNLLLVTNVDQVVTYGTISGADCTLLHVETRDVTDKEVVDAFIVTGDRLTVKRHFHNGYTGGDANARVFKMTGVDNALFENCRFMTKVTTGVINFVTTACTNVVVKNCDFLVDSTTDLSKNVVATIGSNTYEVTNCFDLAAGSSFSGGSGGALAKDDTGAVTTALATLQAEISGAAGLAAFPTGAAAANDVSLAEVIRYTQENICRAGTVLPASQSIYDLIAGANGIATWAAAAAPANGVSLSEALGAVYNLSVPAAATGETVIDEGDYDWAADYPALVTIAPAAGAALTDVVVHLDLAKATTGFAAVYAAQTISVYVERKIDGTNWRRETIAEAALSGTLAASRDMKVNIGDIGITQQARITAILSAEKDGTSESTIPYVVYYKGLAAPTITPLTATP